MAQTTEFLKVRASLHTDPKVGDMAHVLASQPKFLEWLWSDMEGCDTARDIRRDMMRDMSVTPGVTYRIIVPIVFQSVVEVWCAVRTHGRADGDDMVVTNGSLEWVSHIAGVPHFGDAMAKVGWAVAEPAGGLRFPKCLQDMTSAEERKRLQNNERQKNKRAKDRGMASGEGKVRDNSVTDGVTDGVTSHALGHANVTPKSRTELEEELRINTPLPPLSVSEETAPTAAAESPLTYDPKADPPCSGEKLAQDVPAQGQSWPAWLAQEFAAAYKGTSRQHRDAIALLPLFEELLGGVRQYPPRFVRDGIRHAARKRSQAPWEFERWLETLPDCPRPAATLPRVAAANEVSQSVLDQWAREAQERKENGRERASQPGGTTPAAQQGRGTGGAGEHPAGQQRP